MLNYFQRIITGLYSLLVGLAVTFKHLFRRPITLQYPNEKMPMFDRFRGWIRLLYDKKTNQEKCTGCGVCQINCPTGAIQVKKMKEEKKAETFVLDFTICMFCGICVETCPFVALAHTKDYEMSRYKKEELVWDKEKLMIEV